VFAAIDDDADHEDRDTDAESDPHPRRGGPQVPKQVRTRMLRLRKRGYSYGQIAAKLNKDGIPTARNGAKWYRATVRSALGERTKSAA
jgi:hypothetical protein